MSVAQPIPANNPTAKNSIPTTAAKENVPLDQVTLIASLDKGKGKKKRALALANGDELDLMSSLLATTEVLEAMRTRIIELEDELAQQPPVKRARTGNVATSVADASTSAPAGPSVSSVKADEKKRKMQVKKVFDRLKKECKSDTNKFQGSPKTIKIDEVYSEAEFELLFSGKGLSIQPTPQNKPKSVVTIIHFNSQAHIQSFFGDELKPLKGNHWTRGGVPVRTFGGGFGSFGSTFAKSVKTGQVDVAIRTFEVNYSKNNMKCSLKFEVAQQGGGGGCGYGGDDDDSDY